MRLLWTPAIAIVAAFIFVCASERHAAAAEPWEFSRSPSIDEEWHRFSERLALVIGALQKDEFLTISEKNQNVYIQFAARGPLEMRVEAVSSQFYPKLSEDQKTALHDLGWSSPTYVMKPGSMQPSEGSCNYYIDSGKTSLSSLADFAVHTLCGVYHVRRLDALQYWAWGVTGHYMYTIRFPTLGLEPQPLPPVPSSVHKSNVTH